MAANKSTSLSENVALVYKYSVEIQGILEGYFVECKGLQVQRDVEEYKEGGQNTFVHKFPGQIKYSNVTLTRGVFNTNALLRWFQFGKEKAQVGYKNISIILFNQEGTTLKRWELERAYPIKWTGPNLKSSDSNAAIETLELAHHGFKVYR